MNGRVTAAAGSMRMRFAPAGAAAMVLTAATIVVSLSLADYVGWLRLKPEVAAVSWIAGIPDYEVPYAEHSTAHRCLIAPAYA